MTVRTPAKVNRELEAEETEELEHEAEDSDEENSENEQGTGQGMLSSDEADNEFDEDESDDNDEGNTGWADAFAKVLQQEKPKNKKYLVLSKAKKLADKKEQSDDDKKVTFEIAGQIDDDENDEDIKPDVNVEDTKPTNDELELASIARKERNNKLLELRVKPSAMDRERERGFKRIATKGVVQLFNAVRSQQRDLVDRLEKAGPLDHKRDEVLNNINKRQFLDMLMGGKRAKSENVDNPVKDENDQDADSSRPSQWSVLRDDFMTNKKLKHWDNDDEDNGSDNQISNNSMDSDSD
ncbi:RRP15-like protein isoform X1 [Contarinia nasturtii]|uniref:RRP15-like protein isoform X1 n=1 Tax=Contarinia nasturtii TaxID=265458 RepID=UPI0012D413B4|nr:RRP15-like protein isoform X1 [Contarinia nasturtii]